MKMSNVYALNVAIANAICTGRLFSSPKEGFTKQILLDSDRKLMEFSNGKRSVDLISNECTLVQSEKRFWTKERVFLCSLFRIICSVVF